MRPPAHSSYTFLLVNHTPNPPSDPPLLPPLRTHRPLPHLQPYADVPPGEKLREHVHSHVLSTLATARHFF